MISLKKGFTLIEILVVVAIVGVLLAVAVPNYITFIKQTNAQSAQNNLMAILAAEQKYNEDHGNYCLGSACANSNTLINQNLLLNIASNDPFTYSCSSSGSSYACTATATDNSTVLTLNPNATAPTTPVSCLGNSNASYCTIICSGGPNNSYCPNSMQ